MRYTKKPVTIEAVRFIGLTDFGDPQFDVADGMPDWLMEAMSGPEGDVGSIWVDRSSGNPLLAHGYSANIMGQMQTLQDAIPAGDWIVRNEDGHIWICGPDIFEATYDAADDHPGPAWKEGDSLSIEPEIVKVAKEARRSLLLDMQSECIQLRVALAKARDYLMYEYPEMAAMCQKAIDCRPATSDPDCPKLEALDASGREAIADAMDHAGEVTGPEHTKREPQSFVIGEGFKDA